MALAQATSACTVPVPVHVLYKYMCIHHACSLINPRRMREGYGSRSVRVSVCFHASGYIPHLRVQTAVLQGSLWRSERMICVDFAENILFSSFGVIC